MLLTAVENFTALENLNLWNWNWNYAFDKRDSSFRRPGYASLCGAVNQAFASVLAGHARRGASQAAKRPVLLWNLFRSTGEMLGTVCHFDNMPVRVTEDVATVLDDLAPSIAEAAFKLNPYTVAG